MSQQHLKRANQRVLAILLASLAALYGLALLMKYGKELL